MKYVLDASVALKWVLPEEGSDRALALGLEYCSCVHELIAPDALPPEVAHALTRAERRGILTAEVGVAHFTALLKELPEIHASLPLLPRAYELSSQMRLGVFDCLYISLAEREQCQVVTADQRIIQLFPAVAIALELLP